MTECLPRGEPGRVLQKTDEESGKSGVYDGEKSIGESCEGKRSFLECHYLTLTRGRLNLKI